MTMALLPLDALDADGLDDFSRSLGLRPCPALEAIKSITQLIGEKGLAGDLGRFAGAHKVLQSATSQTLIVRLESTADPLLLWALHLELDKRDIPPCLRWPVNDANEQAVFITFSADLLWFCKRNSGHLPRFRGWRGLFKNAPASAKWHATAHRQFIFISPRYSMSHWCSKGLSLTEAQRQDLMMLPTGGMVADRRQLQPAKFAETRQRLFAHAVAHPDRSSQRSSEDVANRRVGLWRLFLLSGRNQTATATHWHRLTGETLTRQAVAKQLAIVSGVLRGHG